MAQESADIRKERLPGNRRIDSKGRKSTVPAIMTDNGGGFACHEKIARRLGTTVYFADSYASWQKGAVENANKLVRQYMPKGTDFREIFDEFIRQIQYKINRKPREKIKLFISQKEVLQFNCLKLHLLVDSAHFWNEDDGNSTRTLKYRLSVKMDYIRCGLLLLYPFQRQCEDLI